MKKALLVVSFGTSIPETREKTIYALERELAAAFPDRIFYRAWTSGIIRKKILRTEGLEIDSVAEALERMAADGVEDLLVQPTHLLDGEENRLMTEAIRAAAGSFKAVSIGAPLLSTADDIAALARVMKEISPEPAADELFAWMGHGSGEMKENVYTALNDLFAAQGDRNVVVGTVEFEPGVDVVLDRIRELKPRRTFLAPLMVVAGDHAVNDMAGEEEDSWRSLAMKEGTEPVCILRGLGEYKTVQALYAAHARAAVWIPDGDTFVGCHFGAAYVADIEVLRRGSGLVMCHPTVLAVEVFGAFGEAVEVVEVFHLG